MFTPFFNYTNQVQESLNTYNSNLTATNTELANKFNHLVKNQDVSSFLSDVSTALKDYSFNGMGLAKNISDANSSLTKELISVEPMHINKVSKKK